MNNLIYQIAISQVVRFLLRLVAVYLPLIGIDINTGNALVDQTTAIVTSMILVLIAEGLGYLERRSVFLKNLREKLFLQDVAEVALERNPDNTTLADIKAEVKTKTAASVPG